MFVSALYSLVSTFSSVGTLLQLPEHLGLLQQLLVYRASLQFKDENNMKCSTVQNFSGLEKLHLTENIQTVI